MNFSCNYSNWSHFIAAWYNAWCGAWEDNVLFTNDMIPVLTLLVAIQYTVQYTF